MRFPSHSLVAVVLAASLSGCALTVAGTNPRPNIDLDRSSAALKLDLSPAVLDEFEVESNGGVAGASVTEWRYTLKNGFKNGLSPFFASRGGDPELTLVIVEAVPGFVPSAVNGYGNAVAAMAQIRYKARLVDASGKVLRRALGTAVGKSSITSRYAASDAVQGAVETMYETLAQELLGHSSQAASGRSSM